MKRIAEYLHARLPEKSSIGGFAVIVVLLVVSILVPAETLNRITESWQALSNLLGVLGLAAILFPERKP